MVIALGVGITILRTRSVTQPASEQISITLFAAIIHNQIVQRFGVVSAVANRCSSVCASYSQAIVLNLPRSSANIRIVRVSFFESLIEPFPTRRVELVLKRLDFIQLTLLGDPAAQLLDRSAAFLIRRITQMRRRNSTSLTLVMLGLLVVGLSGWTNPFFQPVKKTVIRRLTVVKYPVELSFNFKGQPLTSKETVLPDKGIRTNEFDAGADWLKDFTIRVKNTSGKTITYTQVNLRFPEVTSNGRVAMLQIELGVDPNRLLSRPDLRLAPDESLEIPLAPKYDDIRTLLKSAGSGVVIENLSEMEIEFHAALLDDETLFQAGSWYRRGADPNHPDRWDLTKDQPKFVPVHEE